MSYGSITVSEPLPDALAALRGDRVTALSGKCLNVRGGVGQGNQLIQYACVTGGAPNDVWLPVWEDALLK
jgi:hypothetical protein